MRYLFLDEYLNFYLKDEITDDDEIQVEDGTLDIFDLKKKKRLWDEGWRDIPTWEDIQSGS